MEQFVPKFRVEGTNIISESGAIFFDSEGQARHHCDLLNARDERNWLRTKLDDTKTALKLWEPLSLYIMVECSLGHLDYTCGQHVGDIAKQFIQREIAQRNLIAELDEGKLNDTDSTVPTPMSIYRELREREEKAREADARSYDDEPDWGRTDMPDMPSGEFEYRLFEAMDAYFGNDKGKSYQRCMDDLTLSTSDEQWQLVIDTIDYIHNPDWFTEDAAGAANSVAEITVSDTIRNEYRVPLCVMRREGGSIVTYWDYGTFHAIVTDTLDFEKLTQERDDLKRHIEELHSKYAHEGGKPQVMTVDILKKWMAAIEVPIMTDVLPTAPNVFYVSFATKLDSEHRAQIVALGFEIIDQNPLARKLRYMLKWHPPKNDEV